jgi:hypothetical protein
MPRASLRSVLVDLRLQHGLHMSRLNTNHWQARFGENAVKPLRQRSSFQPNSLEAIDGVRQNLQESFRLTRHPRFPHDLARPSRTTCVPRCATSALRWAIGEVLDELLDARGLRGAHCSRPGRRECGRLCLKTDDARRPDPARAHDEAAHERSADGLHGLKRDAEPRERAHDERAACDLVLHGRGSSGSKSVLRRYTHDVRFPRKRTWLGDLWVHA